jgi:hypothetical protein
MKLLLLVEKQSTNSTKELDLIVKESQVVQQDQPVTLNPNVGGFGQAETEVTRSSSYLWILSILYLNYYQSVNVSI